MNEFYNIVPLLVTSFESQISIFAMTTGSLDRSGKVLLRLRFKLAALSTFIDESRLTTTSKIFFLLNKARAKINLISILSINFWLKCIGKSQIKIFGIFLVKKLRQIECEVSFFRTFVLPVISKTSVAILVSEILDLVSPKDFGMT